VVNGQRTGALIVCAPSPNYAWLPGRSLLDVMPKAMSAALLAKVVAWRGGEAKAVGKGGAAKAKPKVASGGGAGQSGASGGGAGQSSASAAAGQSGAHFAPLGDLSELMKMLGLKMVPYTSDPGEPIERVSTAEALKFDHVEQVRARAKAHKCQLCGRGPHDDRVRLCVRLVGGEYVMRGNHFQTKKPCSKTFRIEPGAALAYVERFAARPELSAGDAAAVRARCRAAGLLVSDSAIAWRLAPPAPGFVAHAVRQPGAPWRMVMWSEGAGVALWWRNTKYPGLGYECMSEWDWNVAGGPLGERFPFPIPHPFADVA
jgi:hypothetical protein